MMTMKKTTDLRWLMLGAIAGLVAAAFGILRQTAVSETLPEYAVASVNGRIIDAEQLRDFANDTADVAGGLQRLVDEELLVQRGVELGMMESDMAVRGALLNSLVASITAEADAADPAEAELQKHLADNAERFSYTSKLHVRAWETEDEGLAQELVNKLQGNIELTEEAQADFGDPQRMPDLPDTLLGAETLQSYLGPAITGAAADMPDGSSAVFARRGRWLIVQVVASEKTYVTELETIRNRVLLDYRRALADELLTDYVRGLRDRADIQVAKPE